MTRLSRAVSGGILVFGLVTTGATGSTLDQTIPGRIVPAVGVGKLRLGMSEQAAGRLLSPLGSRKLVRSVTLEAGSEYVEYEYPDPNARWDSYAAYTVGLLGRPGQRRVAVIEVNAARNRTRGNIGVGSVERELMRTYHNLLLCHEFLDLEQTRTRCRLGLSWRRHTIFVLKGGSVSMGRPKPPRRVSRVILRDPSAPLS
jgi:hypothetical protein